MIWDKLTILEQVSTGKDALGNDIYEFKDGSTVKARKTPPADETYELDGRKVTHDSQVFAVPQKATSLPEIKYFRNNGMVYKVDLIEALSPRFTTIRGVIYETRTAGNGKSSN